MISTYADSLSLDNGDVLVDGVDAEYEIDALWGRRSSCGYRSIDYVNSVRLLWWGAARYPRELAATIFGEDAVCAEESRACEAWLERAALDEADEYADHKYEASRDAVWAAE